MKICHVSVSQMPCHRSIRVHSLNQHLYNCGLEMKALTELSHEHRSQSWKTRQTATTNHNEAMGLCKSPRLPLHLCEDKQGLNIRSPSSGGWPTDTSSAVQAEAGPSSTHVNTKLCEPQPSVSVYLSCLVLFY